MTEYEPAENSVAAAIEKIIELNQNIAQFWTRQASGWAPEDAAELLEASRMDRLVALSHSLRLWMEPCPDEDKEGRLILAWANLGILVEGSMTWFLCVWEGSYSQAPMQTKHGVELRPNRLHFEELCRYFREHIWVDAQRAEWDRWLATVRNRRNAVHAFNHREIGDWCEFEQAIFRYADFLAELDSQVPYPDSSCYS